MGPFVVGVNGEVRDDGHVSDFDLVKVLVDYHRRVEGVLSISRDVFLCEVAPHELLGTKKVDL